MSKILCLSICLPLALAIGCSGSGGNGKEQAKVPENARKDKVGENGRPAGPRDHGIPTRSPNDVYVPEKEREPANFAPKPQSRELVGKVTAVDANAHTLTLSVGGVDQSFAVDKEVYVIMGNARQSAVTDKLGGVPAGSEVTVRAFKNGDQDVVSFIKIHVGQ